ncbi:MAG TPA: hypothetical protein VH395_07670 [Jatrophihabitantaceae bacterium]
MNTDTASCHRALDSAAAMLPQTAEQDATPYVALDAVQLTRWRGNVLARLGDDEAIRELNRAVVAIDPEFSRARVGLHTDLAIAFDRAGERAERNRNARIALDLARQSGSARQRHRLLRSPDRRPAAPQHHRPLDHLVYTTGIDSVITHACTQ